jgi:aminoglycoside phosphotransferase (APT) family kinase protein
VIIDETRTAELTEGLLELLREHLAEPALRYAGEPTRLTGGFWAELVAFRIAPARADWDRRLVARVMPDPATALKESAFQLEVARQGYPTPAVRLMRGPDAGIHGRAVMVMDLAEGGPLLAGLDGVAAITKLPTLARRLPAVLAEVLAHLHQLEKGPVLQRLDATGSPRPGIDSMLNHLRSTAEDLDRPALAAVASWLADHRPSSEPEVICHGDMHPFNVLVDAQGQLTVLDWSAAVIAPVGYDLGFTSLMLAEPPLVVPRMLTPLVRSAGRWLERRFLRRYEARAGIHVDVAVLGWYQGLICLRALTEVAGWAAAGTLSGREGHPWVINQAALLGRLHRLTGIAVPAETAVP